MQRIGEHVLKVLVYVVGTICWMFPMFLVVNMVDLLLKGRFEEYWFYALVITFTAAVLLANLTRDFIKHGILKVASLFNPAPPGSDAEMTARPPLESSHDESAPPTSLTKTAKATRQGKCATSKAFQRMILVVLCELYEEDKNATLTPDAMAKRIAAKGWIFNGEAAPADICSKGINDIKLRLDKEGESWSVSMGEYRLIPPHYGRIKTIKSIAEKLR